MNDYAPIGNKYLNISKPTGLKDKDFMLQDRHMNRNYYDSAALKIFLDSCDDCVSKSTFISDVRHHH